MMGVDRLHYQDSMFLELYCGFCRVLKTVEPDCEELGYRGKEHLLQDCDDFLHPVTTRPVISYKSIFIKEPKSPNPAVCQTRPTNFWLAQLQFLSIVHFLEQHNLKLRKILIN